MTAPDRDTHRYGILLLPSFSNLTLASLMEPWRVANRIAQRPVISWSLVTEHGGAVASSSGLRIAPHGAMETLERMDAVFVVASYEAEKYSSPAILRWLRAQARYGAVMGGMETGAYVLALAGLLDGYKATTHWQDLAAFTERFPKIDTVPDRFVVDRERMTSGGALPTLDLVLELLRRDHGLGLAIAVSSMFIYEQEHAGRDPQHMVSAGRLAWQDPVLLRAIRAMEDNIEEPVSIAAVAAQAGVGERELLRRFTLKLETSPKAYYTDLRLNLGRRLLEHTERSVSDVALACGFGSGSAFARAFRERFAMSPTALRRLP
jgi:transcriptional regulator GlxA family with amidase domain